MKNFFFFSTAILGLWVIFAFTTVRNADSTYYNGRITGNVVHSCGKHKGGYCSSSGNKRRIDKAVFCHEKYESWGDAQDKLKALFKEEMHSDEDYFGFPDYDINKCE